MNDKTYNPEPLWYKDAIIYEVRVGSFFDRNNDGIGDIAGITEKLDYIQDLGVTAIWLLPFYPSPLLDDGYDISDYMEIHPDSGTLNEFKNFLKEAHQRGIKVITELVLNHTSDKHPWFQRARHAPAGSAWRNFYVWSDTPYKYANVRIIFKDFERSNWTWDPVANAYYWHRFYSHQPDLNYDNPQVIKTMLQVVDFWLGLGVDGLRLDTIPYLYEREGTNCENLPETHDFIRQLRSHIDKKFKNRMLLAEANQWPVDAVAYYGKGDECHMAFSFPIMPRLFVSIHLEDSFPIMDIMQQTPPIPDTCQWALFLRNHDELTLEMVTDEERDYMYRFYAHDPQARLNLGIRRRLAPLLGNDRRKIELMNGLLFSLPGTPVLYYGDEIGMGDNIYLGDRDGVRTPMQWSPDKNAGFSKANPQQLCLPVTMDPEYQYFAVNVENQQKNHYSLLWWMKHLISLRKRFKAFGRGSIEFLKPKNPKVLTFVRQFQNEKILVVANLSRVVQYVELDLSEFKGMTPLELFGRNKFPPIGELPYLLTLAPYAFYWLGFETPDSIEFYPKKYPLSHFKLNERYEELFQNPLKGSFEESLLKYLKTCSWFRGINQPFKNASLRDKFTIEMDQGAANILFVKVKFEQGNTETYAMPTAIALGPEAGKILKDYPMHIIANITLNGAEGIIFDAIAYPPFYSALLTAMTQKHRFKGNEGNLLALTSIPLRKVVEEHEHGLTPHIHQENANAVFIRFGEELLLKFFRFLDEEVNPELEMGKHLTFKTSLQCVPQTVGSLEYHKMHEESLTLGMLRKYIPSQGTGWTYSWDELGRFYDKTLQLDPDAYSAELMTTSVFDKAQGEAPEIVKELMGNYLESAKVIGQHTAEFHLALAAPSDDPLFSPEISTTYYQRSIYQSKRSNASRTLDLLQRKMSTLSPALQDLGKSILERQNLIIKCFEKILNLKSIFLRIRCHNDYHLGELLYTGKDFVIINFEENQTQTFSQPKIKRVPLKDIASMLRSFHYAAYMNLKHQQTRGAVSLERYAAGEKWAHFWQAWASSAFLKSYLKTCKGSPLYPDDKPEIRTVLDGLILEKSIENLEHELKHNTEWIGIPLQGIDDILKVWPNE